MDTAVEAEVVVEEAVYRRSGLGLVLSHGESPPVVGGAVSLTRLDCRTKRVGSQSAYQKAGERNRPLAILYLHGAAIRCCRWAADGAPGLTDSSPAVESRVAGQFGREPGGVTRNDTVVYEHHPPGVLPHLKQLNPTGESGRD